MASPAVADDDVADAAAAGVNPAAAPVASASVTMPADAGSCQATATYTWSHIRGARSYSLMFQTSPTAANGSWATAGYVTGRAHSTGSVTAVSDAVTSGTQLYFLAVGVTFDRNDVSISDSYALNAVQLTLVC